MYAAHAIVRLTLASSGMRARTGGAASRLELRTMPFVHELVIVRAHTPELLCSLLKAVRRITVCVSLRMREKLGKPVLQSVIA
jgi:hypothetical protein